MRYGIEQPDELPANRWMQNEPWQLALRYEMWLHSGFLALLAANHAIRC